MIHKHFSELRRYFSTDFKNIMSSDRFVWIDLELTGLDLTKDKILEVACVITKTNLEVVGEKVNIVIHETNEVLDSMTDFVKNMHTKNGLIEACKRSKYCLKEAENQVTDYIKQYCKGVNYLAGNSVHYDKLFLEKYMPSVNKLLHYQIIDVSSIKVLCSHWYPEAYKTGFKKKLLHRASEDIMESIKELQTYRKVIFK